MKLINCLLLICGSFSVYSQASLLDRRISISINNERLDVSLKRISAAGGFTFSYNPAIVEDERIVNFNFINTSIREILDEIFQGAVRYKTRGKYIILTSGQGNSAEKEPAIVTGYVVDEASGERLRDVSIYDPVTLTSTITDSNGYFEIKIDRPSPDLILSVNRRNYTDTLVVVPAQQRRLLNIPIRIDSEKVVVLADSVGRKVERFWKKQVLWFENINLSNIDDTLQRTYQMSLVPYVGTNHKMSGHVINDYSLNILGGYSLGVRKLEFGGLFNLVRGDMKGAQFAGLFNSVGGEMNGVQFAGIFNGNHGISRGARFAGILNLNAGAAEGVQFAGISNITTGSQRGPQFGGVFNVASKDGGPMQMAGIYNLTAKEMKGFQAAGVFNFTGKSISGTQLAGVFNFTGKRVKGAQISGVLNYAKKVNGTQIGLINIADSVRGVPVGFMSIVFKGYHKIEISADEIFYNNISFRTGVRQFYNIITAGAKPSTYNETETFWTFGYGIGSAPRLSKKLFLNFDLTSNQIVRGKSIGTDLLNKLYVGLDYQAFRKMSVTFGATLNGHITESSVDALPSIFADYQPNVFYNRALGSDRNMKMWMGAKVGLRFL